jgi:hypothetical protein
MEYNFPVELESLSEPKIKFDHQKIQIKNRPTPHQQIVSLLSIVFAPYLIFIKKLPFDDPYVLMCTFLCLGLISLTYSLNRVNIDFSDKTIVIANYNPLINLWRKFMQMPQTLKFKEIDITSDFALRKGGSYYYVAFVTEAPYTYKIAIFQKEKLCLLFKDYLKARMKR